VTLQGTDLGLPGTVAFSGIPAVVTRWTTTAIDVILPEVEVFTVGKITVTPAGRSAIVTVFEFAITLGLPTDPVAANDGFVGPVIDSLGGPNGGHPSVFFVGDQLAIDGYGFGSAGELYLSGIRIDTVSWQDTRIVATLPNLPNLHHNFWLTVYNTRERFLTTGLNYMLVPKLPPVPPVP